MSNSNTIVFSQLLKARTASEIERTIESYTRKLKWTKFNRDGTNNGRGNKGTITMGQDPIRALVERLTNSMDAVVERQLIEKGVSPTEFSNPKEAIEALFPNLDDRLDHVLMVVEPFNKFSDATVDVMDNGTGIPPNMAFKTILSLNEDNKINKRYSIGTYGQGGAQSIGMVHGEPGRGYVIVASRAAGCPIWFTIIRFREADPAASDKRGFYECLVDTNDEVLTVENMVLPKQSRKILVPKEVGGFPQGTLVRHFGYDLSRYSGKWATDPDGCRAAINTYLFRSPLPVHVDLAYKSKNPKKAVADGHPLQGKGDDAFNTDKRKVFGCGTKLDGFAAGGDEVDYAAPPHKMEIKRNGKKEGEIVVRYWVLNPKPKTFRLTHPVKTVFGVFYGQTWDERTVEDLSSKIRDTFQFICGGGKHDLVIEVEVDGLTSRALDNLQASTRESFKNGECLEQIDKTVTEFILQDEELAGINNSRYESTISSAKKESKKSIYNTVRSVVDFVRSALNWGTLVTGGGKRVRHAAVPPQPIVPSKGAPSFVRFKVDEVQFNLASDGPRYFMIETDAPNGHKPPDIFFDGEGQSYFSVETTAPLKDGRMRIKVDLKGGQPGFVGDMVAQYGKDVRAEVPYEMVKKAPSTRSPQATVKGQGTQKGMPECNCVPVITVLGADVPDGSAPTSWITGLARHSLFGQGKWP